MDDTIKIIKSLEYPGVSETVKYKIKKQKGGFFGCY